MYEKLNRKAIGCMLGGEIVASIITTAILAVVWNFVKDVRFVISPDIIWGLVAFIWVMTFISPFIRYQRYRYRFTDEEIEVKEGLLAIERNIVPIERLHQVALDAGPIDRMFGLSKVIVTTAGGNVTIRFIETEVAEQIVDRLKVRINLYGAQEKQKKLKEQYDRVTKSGSDTEKNEEI